MITSSESEDEDRRNNRKRHIFRRRMIWDDGKFSAAQFRCFFRCSAQNAQILLQIIGGDIKPKYHANHALGAKERLLIALRFYGGNADFHEVAAAEHVSTQTVCNMVHLVTSAVLRRMHHLLAWPDDLECRRRIARRFFNMSNPGVPFVAGALDGSLIPIQAPTQDEAQFVDRHQNHSLNVMGIAGPDLYFYALSCRYPGSLHDARVLKNSAVYEDFEGGYRPFPNAIVIADSAYPRKSWLIPVQRNPQARYAQLFTAIMKIRRVIESAWGLLKSRFGCTTRKLRLKNPATAAAIIKAFCILHNFLIIVRDEWEGAYYADPESPDAESSADEEEVEENGEINYDQSLKLLNHAFTVNNL